MDGVRLRYEQTCADCGGSEFVEDHAQGDLVCTTCGLVAESHVIDESSEWRNFGDKDGDTADPSRVGGPTNHLLSNGGLSTAIGAPTKGAVNATMTRNLQRAHAQGSNPDQSLLRAFGHISRLGDALGLNRACKDRANELFKNTWEKRGIRGKGVAAVCAAVTLIACRQVGFPRTFKEMEAVVAEGSIKDIKRCYRLITKQMDEKMEMVTPADYVRRFCSHLGLTQRDMKAAEEMAEAAVPRNPAAAGVSDSRARLWDGKSPVSIAAGVIYTICLLPQASKAVSPADIAQAAGVAEGTVRNTYRDLYADVATLVPPWFLDAQRLDLRRLPQPHSAAPPV